MIETAAPPVELPLPDVCSAFRKSADCNTEFCDTALNIAGVAVPRFRFQFLFRAVLSDREVHNLHAEYMCRLLLNKSFTS